MRIHNEPLNAQKRYNAPEAPLLILGLTQNEYPVSLSGNEVGEGILVCGSERRDYLASLTAQCVEANSGFIHFHAQGSPSLTHTIQSTVHHMGGRDLFVLDLANCMSSEFPVLAWNPLRKDPKWFFTQWSALSGFVIPEIWEILLAVWKDKNHNKPMNFRDAHQWFKSKEILLSIPSQPSLSAETRESVARVLTAGKFPDVWQTEWDNWEKMLGTLAAIPAFHPAHPLTFEWDTVLRNKLNLSVILPSASQDREITKMLARLVLESLKSAAAESSYDTASAWAAPMLCLLDDAGDYFYTDLTADIGAMKKKGLAFAYGIPDMSPFKEDKNRALSIWRNTGIKVFLKMHDTETFIVWINPMLSHISSMSGNANTSFAGLASLQNKEAFLVHRNDVVQVHWFKTLSDRKAGSERKCIAYPRTKPEDLFMV
jgi:hypothetical protein